MNFNHCMKYRMHKLKEESEFHLYKKPKKEESECDVELTKVAPLHPQERLKRINKKTIKKNKKKWTTISNLLEFHPCIWPID